MTAAEIAPVEWPATNAGDDASAMIERAVATATISS